MLSVVHAANCRQLNSGISLAAVRTESISWEASLFTVACWLQCRPQVLAAPSPQPPVVCAPGDS